MQIFYAIKKFIINFFGSIVLYPRPMFVMFYGSVHYKFKGDNLREVLDMIEPGDILLRTYDNYLSSMVIPGYWSHAGLYVGDDKVIHVGGDGIIEEDILTFTRCDDIALLRIDDDERINSAIAKAYDFLAQGIKYDYDFSKNNGKKMYCTEFTDECYGGISYVSSKGIIDPDDLLKSEFKIVYPGRK